MKMPAPLSRPSLQRSWQLFWIFFRMVSLVLGGGYAIIAAAREEFVERRHWLNDDDFADMAATIQTVPGLLACNAAVYLGWRLNGWIGALAALTGAVLPSFFVIVAVAVVLSQVRHCLELPRVQGAFKGVVACISGIIIAAGLKLRKKSVRNLFDWLVAAGSFAGLTFFRIPAVRLIVSAIVLGIGAEILIRRCGGRKA